MPCLTTPIPLLCPPRWTQASPWWGSSSERKRKGKWEVNVEGDEREDEINNEEGGRRNKEMAYLEKRWGEKEWRNFRDVHEVREVREVLLSPHVWFLWLTTCCVALAQLLLHSIDYTAFDCIGLHWLCPNTNILWSSLACFPLTFVSNISARIQTIHIVLRMLQGIRSHLDAWSGSPLFARSKPFWKVTTLIFY